MKGFLKRLAVSLTVLGVLALLLCGLAWINSTNKNILEVAAMVIAFIAFFGVVCFFVASLITFLVWLVTGSTPRWWSQL